MYVMNVHKAALWIISFRFYLRNRVLCYRPFNSIGVIMGKPVIAELAAKMGITFDRYNIHENGRMFSLIGNVICFYLLFSACVCFLGYLLSRCFVSLFALICLFYCDHFYSLS